MSKLFLQRNTYTLSSSNHTSLEVAVVDIRTVGPGEVAGVAEQDHIAKVIDWCASHSLCAPMYTPVVKPAETAVRRMKSFTLRKQ